MMLFLLDGILIMLLLFCLRAFKDQKEQYKEILQLKSDLGGLLRQMQTSMKLASTTTEDLREHIAYVGEKILPNLPKAATLQEDFAFLIEHGESVANRLEKILANAKKEVNHYDDSIKPQLSIKALATEEIAKTVRLKPYGEDLKEYREETALKAKGASKENDEESTIKQRFFANLRRFR